MTSEHGKCTDVSSVKSKVRGFEAVGQYGQGRRAGERAPSLQIQVKMVDSTAPAMKEKEEVTENVYDIMKGFDRWAREQKEVKERWRQRIAASVEEMMKQAEEGKWLTEEEAEKSEPEQWIVKQVAGERVDVVEVVILQHKQALLGEWESAVDVWAMQAETWAGKCAICRIRKGSRIKHDWRECPTYEDECAKVEVAHAEMEGGVLSIDSLARFEGRCPGCTNARDSCWLQIRHTADKSCCRFAGVVTESAAAIMALGPEMVEEWERREGRRRGAGTTGIEKFTQQRFGGLDVGSLWRTFGWVGVWDIDEARVDNVCAAWERRLRSLTKKEGATALEGSSEREWRYGVRGGEIGGRPHLGDDEESKRLGSLV